MILNSIASLFPDAQRAPLAPGGFDVLQRLGSYSAGTNGYAGQNGPPSIHPAAAPQFADAPGVSYESMLTPTQEGKGISGFLANMRRRATTPDANGMTFFDRLKRFGAELQDIDDGGSRSQHYREMAQAQAARREALQQADEWGLQGKERFLFLANPKAYTEALSSHIQAANVGQGETRLFGEGGSAFTAPRFGFEGGIAYRQESDGRPEFYGSRPINDAEAADDALGRDRYQEDVRHNKASEALGVGNLGVAQGNLGVARDRHALDVRQYEAPPVNSVGSAVTPIFIKMSRGETLTPGEQSALRAYQTAKADPLISGLMGDLPEGGPDELSGGREPASAPGMSRRTPPGALASPQGQAAPGTFKPERALRRPVRKDKSGAYLPQSVEDLESVPKGAMFVNPADGRLVRRK